MKLWKYLLVTNMAAAALAVEARSDSEFKANKPEPGQFVVSVMCYVKCIESHRIEPCDKGLTRKWLAGNAGASGFVLYAYLEEQDHEEDPIVGYVNKIIVLDAGEQPRQDIYSIEPVLIAGPFKTRAAAARWAKEQGKRPGSRMTLTEGCGRNFEVMKVVEVRSTLLAEKRVISPVMTVDGAVIDVYGGGAGQTIKLQAEDNRYLFLTVEPAKRLIEARLGEKLRISYREISILSHEGEVLYSWTETLDIRRMGQ